MAVIPTLKTQVPLVPARASSKGGDDIGARQCVQLRACNPTGGNPVK